LEDCDVSIANSIVFARVRRVGVGALPLVALLGLSACVTQPPPRVVSVPAPAPQKIFVYPQNGQSQEQLDRDRYECHLWAVQQTGVDPSRADASPYERVVVQPSTPPGANTAAGAITGAILGAIIAGPRAAGAGLVLGGATGRFRRRCECTATGADDPGADQFGRGARPCARRFLSSCLGRMLDGAGLHRQLIEGL
jgi:hypothetical protein